MKRSISTGLLSGFAMAVVTVWPVSKLVTALVSPGDGAVIARLVHQGLLWTIGWAGAFALLRLERTDRIGAFIAALGPPMFDAVLSLAFGMLPVVMGTWADRALAAVAATAIWLSFSSRPR
ncbi:MAG: hypothetical protein AAF654_10270 [Myxococcota bacterium]